MPEPSHGLVRRSVLLGGTGAVAFGLLAALGMTFQAAARTFSTRRGEIRLIPLDDGSTLTLNTASTVRVKFSDAERHVELIEGEALFDVAREPRRPFVVVAGDTQVSAVGTRFTVSHLARQPLQILVSQGTVEVENVASTEVKRLVPANSKAVISSSRPVQVVPISADEVSRELAWREGMLAFEDKPLREAAGDFARYSDVRIAFESQAIADETVTGLFAANDPAGFARSAALGLGLKVRNQPDGTVLLYEK